ncbi:hypothetical protein D3P07_05425 [Paenibacillus sp. 1011MAR3C5]|uniref:hypothetical protein n=1 Tax=Paenibacillus sp. 1011MAR3C5 TaxID=1675787 RepID=UPI000E6D3DA7|nr:hypothetical protein [Paenibacillus sp. 1011MAR3C5]RJE89679.1 hypothetical protein D3P07_05425 [Paenibacillus sp. 1011MAR3C5]
MSENNQQAPTDSEARLRLEELKEEGKALSEQEMNQVAGGGGPSRTHGGFVLQKPQLQGNAVALPGKTIFTR